MVHRRQLQRQQLHSPPRILHRADKPYEKLKKPLEAEIDEAAWSSLYSTVSCPFDAPEEGKIAVKVINHYGDEVLKVCDTRNSSNGHH